MKQLLYTWHLLLINTKINVPSSNYLCQTSQVSSCVISGFKKLENIQCLQILSFKNFLEFLTWEHNAFKEELYRKKKVDEEEYLWQLGMKFHSALIKSFSIWQVLCCLSYWSLYSCPVAGRETSLPNKRIDQSHTVIFQ